MHYGHGSLLIHRLAFRPIDLNRFFVIGAVMQSLDSRSESPTSKFDSEVFTRKYKCQHETVCHDCAWNTNRIDHRCCHFHRSRSLSWNFKISKHLWQTHVQLVSSHLQCKRRVKICFSPEVFEASFAVVSSSWSVAEGFGGVGAKRYHYISLL